MKPRHAEQKEPKRRGRRIEKPDKAPDFTETELSQAFESSRRFWAAAEVREHPAPGDFLRWVRGLTSSVESAELRLHTLRCSACLDVWSSLRPSVERPGVGTQTFETEPVEPPPDRGPRGAAAGGAVAAETPTTNANERSEESADLTVPLVKTRESGGGHLATGAIRVARLVSAELYRQMLGIAGRDTRESDTSRVCHSRWIDFARAISLLPEALEGFVVLGARKRQGGGELINAIVVEARAADAELARHLALEALHSIDRLASACLDYAEMDLVRDAETLDALTGWIHEPAHASEIRRRWERIRAGVLARGRVGLAAIDEDRAAGPRAHAKTQDLRHLYPWVPSDDSWQRLSTALLAEPTSAALVVHFRGFRRVPDAAQDQARSALAEIERAQGMGVSTKTEGSAAFFGHLQALSQEALARVSELQGDMVAARVFLTGEQRPSPPLEAIAAASLDDASVDVSRPSSEWLFRGGTTVRQAEAHEVTDPLDAPSLDILFGPREASAVLRTPMPGMVELPGMPLNHARTAPAKSATGSGCPLGVNVYRGLRQPIAVSESIRARHVYIVGQTGTGKSTTMLPMVLHDIAAGTGAVVVLDPHGSLVEDILQRFPAHRESALMVIDPGDVGFPVPFNPLVIPEDAADYAMARDLIIDDLYSYVDEAYDLKLVGGPMFETHFRGMLTLLMGSERPPNYAPSLLHLRYLYQEKPLRARLLKGLKGDRPQNALISEMEATTGDHALNNMSQWVTSKFQRFVGDRALRNMTCQNQTIDFSEVLRNKSVVLVNLSRGRFGEKAAGLLASQIVSRLQLALMARGAEAGSPVYFYADEFQIFAGPKFAELLAEGRKFRFAATMAHQFAEQLSKEMLGAVLGNVGTTIAFRLGPKDAELLSGLFQPTFGHDDLTRLPNFRACARSVDPMLDLVPFSLEARRPADDGDVERSVRLREVSRSRYGRPRAEVEAEIEASYDELGLEKGN